ncbi:unconventional myosin-XVIIIa-like [Drosophila miranda]|uniref:unconventional myosin-XVIIIa-like n=1 Tax=Drosophila miranda TaxID=7229 RepID=UPI00143F1C28|nr:unconventional myosin-XVIIIa-like [Drosophila miranda]
MIRRLATFAHWRSMSLGRYSIGRVPGKFKGSTDSTSFPVMDSDSYQGSEHEPKTDLSLTAEQPQSLATTEDDTLQGESYMRIQMLESHQSDFVQSLGSLDPLQSEMIGTYKCMPLVLKEDSKWVVQNKDPILNLPTECVQDLKDHCQAAVDSGFMLLYDQLERVRLANYEFQATQQLLVNLKSLLLRKHNEFMEARILETTKTHNEQMHRLQADLEVKLKAEQDKYLPKLEKLQKLLRDCEAQRDDYERQLKHKDDTIESIMAESNKKMSLNLNLEHQLAESSAELARTRNELVESREHMAYLEAEWKEEHEDHESEESTQSVQQAFIDLEHVKSELYESQQLVGEMRAQAKRDDLMICRYTEEINTCRLKETDSQRAYQKLCLESADKDVQINKMRLKLDLMEEQLSHAYEKQALQKQEIKRLEEFSKVSEEENARVTVERDQYQLAKNTEKQQVENLTQQLQEFVDFLLSKGKPPAIIEGLIHVCNRCGCIHQRQHQSRSTVA